MTSGSNCFLYEDDYSAIMVVYDADMLQSDEEWNVKINSWIKNMPLKIKLCSRCEFCDKVYRKRNHLPRLRKLNLQIVFDQM